MRLLIQQTEAKLAYLPFMESNTGAVLQILLQGRDDKNSLHRRLAGRLKHAYRHGVMDESKVEGGYTEIRLLGATMLEAIDLIRMSGFGVTEINPHEGL